MNRQFGPFGSYLRPNSSQFIVKVLADEHRGVRVGTKQ